LFTDVSGNFAINRKTHKIQMIWKSLKTPVFIGVSRDFAVFGINTRFVGVFKTILNHIHFAEHLYTLRIRKTPSKINYLPNWGHPKRGHPKRGHPKRGRIYYVYNK